MSATKGNLRGGNNRAETDGAGTKRAIYKFLAAGPGPNMSDTPNLSTWQCNVNNGQKL